MTAQRDSSGWITLQRRKSFGKHSKYTSVDHGKYSVQSGANYAGVFFKVSTLTPLPQLTPLPGVLNGLKWRFTTRNRASYYWGDDLQGLWPLSLIAAPKKTPGNSRTDVKLQSSGWSRPWLPPFGMLCPRALTTFGSPPPWGGRGPPAAKFKIGCRVLLAHKDVHN